MSGSAERSPIVNPFRNPADISESPHDTSGAMSSAGPSRSESSAARRKEKKRVGWSGGTESGDRSTPLRTAEFGLTVTPPQAATPNDGNELSVPPSPSVVSRNGSGEALSTPDDRRSHLPELSPQQTQQIHEAFNFKLPITKPRPAIRLSGIGNSVTEDQEDTDTAEDDGPKAMRRARAKEAFERGKRLELDERVRSAPQSRFGSPERFASGPPTPSMNNGDIPLITLDGKTHDKGAVSEEPRDATTEEARKLVRKHTVSHGAFQETKTSGGFRSGFTTPTEEQDFIEDYQPPPEQYRGGILSALMKLYQNHPKSGHERPYSSNRPSPSPGGSGGDYFSYASSPHSTPPESGASTPGGTYWFGRRSKHQSTSSLGQLIGSSTSLGSPSFTSLGEINQKLMDHQREQNRQHRPGHAKRSRSTGALAALSRMSRPRIEEQSRITIHIAETINRQKYLVKLCRALMLYGAPTHRLEEYMNMSARVLEIQAQFLYIPGSMIMSFDDPDTHTTEVKLVRVNQGLDLGKLRDVHEVYKEVVHDRAGVNEATDRLKEITEKKDKHPRWFRIFFYGIAALSVGPFAFGARFIDLPICFLLGCILGILQLVVAPRSDLYANVFEIAATVITSFLARAFGSIPSSSGGRIFCFAALAQSSIALILPGYTVLCASLELQSKSIVAGSVRMVYAIIYSLFLGYGITIGTALYGIMDRNATSATTCENPMEAPLFFIFVPIFTMCLIIINQAKWKQAPVMLIISFAGYVVNYFSSKRFAGNTQVSNTLGALVIGVMANLYSRVGARWENTALDIWEDRIRPRWKEFRRRVLHMKGKAKQKVAAVSMKEVEEARSTSVAHDGESVFVRSTRRVGYGLAAAAMLPAIFVQVPSGLSVNGSLVSGIASADQIAGNATNGTTVVNATTLASKEAINSVALTVGYSVIQVAIGITVGLFLAAIVVYPFGKKRSGLFSF
ncbi:Hypothetical protein R9X50_00541800 [Acrodontium crateriforme]|uniref:Threonine/serine exporter-like N-terminal domain-containing protein n=1 Tax=Acrodontium crateriforme TaxID=150365 RepID=A0AAQ3M7J6_9PEZI|nr:Hypothetical protein R9X50_00541800 [Acrodontium crateriforme]